MMISSTVGDFHLQIFFPCPQPGCCVEAFGRDVYWPGETPILQGPAYCILCHKQEGYPELGGKTPAPGPH